MLGASTGEKRVPQKEKREQAPALHMEFSTASIIPVDRGKSRKALKVCQFPVSPSPGSDSLQSMIGDPDNDYAERCFKIPNPFYFIGPPLPDAGLKCLSH